MNFGRNFLCGRLRLMKRRIVLPEEPPPARPTVAELIAAEEARRKQGPWYPACGGTEVPFTTRTGRRLLYCLLGFGSGPHPEQSRSDDCDGSVLMPRKPNQWTIQTTTKSHCGQCDRYLDLLCRDQPTKRSPMFYICWHCQRIFVAGVGQVKREIQQ